MLVVRHYWVDNVIAWIFRTSKRKISEFRSNILHMLQIETYQTLTMPSPLIRKLNSVVYGEQLIVMALDGFEQPATKSVQKKLSNLFHSAKKKQISITKLIGVDPKRGGFMYLSKSYCGSVVDDAITKFHNEQIELNSNEKIIADKGFQSLVKTGNLIPHRKSNGFLGIRQIEQNN